MKISQSGDTEINEIPSNSQVIITNGSLKADKVGDNVTIKMEVTSKRNNNVHTIISGCSNVSFFQSGGNSITDITIKGPIGKNCYLYTPKGNITASSVGNNSTLITDNGDIKIPLCRVQKMHK